MRIRKHIPVDLLFSDEDIINAAKISDALAHPARIKMFRFILTENLARRTVTNKDLVFAFDYAQATISQHLSKLLIGGLIEVKKRGTSSCYFAKVGKLSHFTDTLKKIESRGDEEEMPGFLRAELFEAETSEDERNEELSPEDFEDGLDDDFDDAPRFF